MKTRRDSLYLALLALGACAAVSGCDSKKKTVYVTAAATASNTNTGPTQVPTTSPTPSSSSTTAALAVQVVEPDKAEALSGPDVVAMALNLSSTGSDPVHVQSITLQASGTLDESTGIEAARLVGDDNADGKLDAGETTLVAAPSPAFPTDDGGATFTFSPALTIAPGASLQLLVVVDTVTLGAGAVASVGKTLKLEAAPSDILASDGSNPVTPSVTPPANGIPETTLFLNEHLVVSEVVPAIAGQYVELHNPTSKPIDLTTVYLTNASAGTAPFAVYPNLPTGAGFGPTQPNQFVARFPAGATIPVGGTIVVAVDGVDFQAAFAQAADYCLRDPSGGSVQMLTPDATVPPVWSATPVAATASLLATDDKVVVFLWDGVEDLVEDIDYLYWGPGQIGRVDKTGLAVDGPDADTNTQAYFPETPVANQSVHLPAAAPNHAIQRIGWQEGAETGLGSNGVAGDDETSEPFAATLQNGAPTPGTP